MSVDNTNQAIWFYGLRKRVFDAIRRELERDPHCKSYEGAFEWTTCYPNYFDDERAEQAPCWYILELHCYVLGPARHYRWDGKTRSEVLTKAEKDINSWLIQLDEVNNDQA